MEADRTVIETRGLTKRYGSNHAVNNLSMRVAKGSIHGFLGPNGSGKTTTIRMLSGLLKPTSGYITVLGQSMPECAEYLRSRLGYMTQRFSLYEDLTVAENLRFVGEIHTIPSISIIKRVGELIDTFGLTKCRQNRVGNLSGGERQRLALAAATLHEPDVLFLDEPTSAINPRSRRDFWDLLFHLSECGTTILINTHYMDEAHRCHALGILDDGEMVACDSPDRLIEGLDAHVVGVTTDRLDHSKAILMAAGGIISVTQIGSGLRVLVDRATRDPVNLVKRCLDVHGGSKRIAPLQPNLEDVFVITTNRSTGGAS